MSLSFEDCQKLINSLPEALFLVDLEGNILAVNEQACRMLGYEDEELLDLNIQDLVQEYGPGHLPDQVDRATLSGEPLKAIGLSKDGTEIHVELQGRKVEAEGSKRTLISIRTVTSRDNAGRELEASKRQYHSYLKELGDAIFVLDMEKESYGEILDVNATAEKQTGYSREELLGMNLMDEMATGESPEIEYEEANQKLSRGETVSFIEKKIKKDDTEYWTEVVLTPIRHRGKKANLSINRDVTERIRARKSLKAEKDKLKELHGAVEKFKSCQTEEELYETTLEVTENVLGLDVCLIYTAREDKLVPVASNKLDVSELPSWGMDEALVGAAYTKGETIWGDDLREVKEAQPKDPGLRAYMSVPLGDLGVLQAASKEEGAFTETEVELVEILVGHLAEEVKRIRLEKELRQKAHSIQSTKEKLELLHEAAGDLESAQDKEEIYRIAVRAAENTLDFPFCSLGIVEDEKIVTKESSSRLPPEGTKTMTVEEGLSGKTYRTKKTYCFGDIRQVEETEPVNSGYRSAISVPIGDLGVLQVVSKEIDDFTEEEVRLVELLGGHVYEALRRLQLEEKLKQQAIHDPLTGLYNRRHFNETLGKEVERCKRYGNKIAFVMIDVNRFKEINDRYSHQTGDEVLQEVAGLLQSNVRDADTIVRYGGDEFLIMMPETNGEAQNTVKRLRRKITHWNEESDLLDFPLTLDMGISHWSSDQDRDVEKALKEADEKMYEDKGR
ncbi:diguanylate cyclase [Candidatus Bipolaricaulota bacterium]|nr:diguanylate cyclase [Candidatus Bipolaricaulota bacterium]